MIAEDSSDDGSFLYEFFRGEFSQGKTEAFLVYDRTLKSIHASFYSWLRDEGFTDAGPTETMGANGYISTSHASSMRMECLGLRLCSQLEITQSQLTSS